MPWFARACPRRLTNRSEVPSTLIDVKQVLQQVRNRSVEQHGGKSFLVFFQVRVDATNGATGGTVASRVQLQCFPNPATSVGHPVLSTP